MNFYTNVAVRGNKILFRGIIDGKKVKRKIDFSPSLFISTNEDTKFQSIRGQKLGEIKPGGPKECKAFISKYADVDGFDIYGNRRYEYSFISDYFSNPEWDIDHIDISNIDIEVATSGGYASPENPYQPIISITEKRGNKVYVWGLKEFVTDRKDVFYYQCRNEMELLKSFLNHWCSDYPDVITGWYVKHFDIPYIIARLVMLFGETEANRISPWGSYNTQTKTFMNRDQTAVYILGIAILDYIELYKKFSAKGASQESYSLNNIASVELGEKKLDYSEYANLNELFEKNHQKAIEYNIRDVELVERIDDKLRLMELALTLAYDSLVNYEDSFMQVRMWDILIYNKLKKNNIAIPPALDHDRVDYDGGYVKDPQVGMHRWIVSFDLTSLYPHLIMQFNISPDTIVEPEQYTDEMRELLSQGITVQKLLDEEIDVGDILKKNHVTMTPNGQFFDVRKKAFLSEMMEEMFSDRSRYKKEMLKYEQERQTADPSEYNRLDKLISRYNNLQLTKKVCLNSAYGALGNNFCRYYDVRQAEGITSGGQLAIKWVARDINAYLNKLLKTVNKDYIIASDTDSIYIELDSLVKEVYKSNMPDNETIVKFLDQACEKQLQPYIDASYKRLAEYLNVFDQKMIMKREVIADVGVWTAKKRYILNVYNSEGIQYSKPKLKISGMEGIKSSTPNACREKIKKAYEIIVTKTESDMIKYIEEFKEQFYKLPPEDISFPRSMNGLEKYGNDITIYSKGSPIHVKGSLIYNHFLKVRGLDSKYEKIKDGEKIKFAYLKEPNPFGSGVISFMNTLPKEFDAEKYIDYNTQFSKTFLEPLKLILDVVGWKTEKKLSLWDIEDA